VPLPDQGPLENAESTTPGLVPITVVMPETHPSGDIKIEIYRSQTLISITWPVSQSTSCADWLREGHQLRVHRGVLQPETAALNAGLHVTDPVPGELAQSATAGKTVGINPTLWQTKNRGNLSYSLLCY
jgi:hypothetical protein